MTLYRLTTPKAYKSPVAASTLFTGAMHASDTWFVNMVNSRRDREWLASKRVKEYSLLAGKSRSSLRVVRLTYSQATFTLDLWNSVGVCEICLSLDCERTTHNCIRSVYLMRLWDNCNRQTWVRMHLQLVVATEHHYWAFEQCLCCNTHTVAPGAGFLL